MEGLTRACFGPALCADNVYGALPKSTARTASIILMLIHQIVAYALCA